MTWIRTGRGGRGRLVLLGGEASVRVHESHRCSLLCLVLHEEFSDLVLKVVLVAVGTFGRVAGRGWVATSMDGSELQ